MKKLILALLLAAPSYAGKPQTNLPKTALSFPNRSSITVDIADTPGSREFGLMNRRKIPHDYGMLFVFPKESFLVFWMKNTLASLDIIYVSSDKTITSIHRRMRPSTEYTKDADVARCSGRAQFVLELAAGEADRRKLKEGDALKFKAVIPTL